MISFRSPLLELHNLQPCLPSACQPASSNTPHMPSDPAVTDCCNDYSSTTAPAYLTPQDSGLGIRTDENGLLPQYNSRSSEPCDQPYFDDAREHGRPACPSKLASPFNERLYTPGTTWADQDPTSVLSNGLSTPYGTTPDHYLDQYVDCLGSVQYMTPNSNVNFTPSNSLSTPNGEFKRPAMRHRSASSIIPQTTINTPYEASNGWDASPCQWITPDWHDPIPYSSTGTLLLPSTMLTYMECGNAEQSQHATQPRQKPHAAMTVPSRRKPHLRPSYSESCVPRHSTSASARARALSMGQKVHTDMNNAPVQQLPLPALPPSILIKTPHLQNQAAMFTTPPAPTNQKQKCVQSVPQRWRRPSSPPPTDIHNPSTPFLAPVRQDPTFPGDLYTPRYKRRTSTGRWEGWCGYCQPGRWLDLKNSRFWEDKLRNHGICAKTKMRFAEPEKIRWVDMDGKVSQTVGLGLEVGDFGTEQKKREGLCGVCKTWVHMDGMRTKARDRAVGWWMHAYKVSFAAPRLLCW